MRNRQEIVKLALTGAMIAVVGFAVAELFQAVVVAVSYR